MNFRETFQLNSIKLFALKCDYFLCYKSVQKEKSYQEVLRRSKEAAYHHSVILRGEEVILARLNAQKFISVLSILFIFVLRFPLIQMISRQLHDFFLFLIHEG